MNDKPAPPVEEKPYIGFYYNQVPKNIENAPKENRTFVDAAAYSAMYILLHNIGYVPLFQKWGKPIRVTFPNGIMFEYQLPEETK